MKHARREQTIGEEAVNSITHGVGTGLSIAALVILVVLASLRGDPWRIVSFSIYGSALVLLYLVSTLYHSFPWPNVKRFFRHLDHAAIFLLIAGTYTPFTLVCMRGAWGWTLFGIVWGIALFGIVFKAFFLGRYEFVETLLYIAMGWVCVIAIGPILRSVPMNVMAWLAGGGLCYTLGVIFYAWRRMPYHHGVWHGFVLGGSVLHFFGMLWLALP